MVKVLLHAVREADIVLCWLITSEGVLSDQETQMNVLRISGTT